MQASVWEKLVGIMARMAADRAAAFELYEEFGATIANAMRRHLRDMGVHDLTPGDLDGLVIDACLELQRVAAGWDPSGGALPWTWAAARLRGLASAHVGVWAEPWDGARHDREEEPVGMAGPDDRADWDLLCGLAGRGDDRCALLVEALERVASVRDRAVFVELRAQAVDGDPSPAATIGRRHRMAPDAVRQVGSRVRRRLRDLARTDPRFAPLADVPLVA